MKIPLKDFPVQPGTLECCKECSGKPKACQPDPMNCTDFYIWNKYFIDEQLSLQKGSIYEGPATDTSDLREDENFICNKFGYCYYALEPSPLIHSLYVEPQYRRRGHSKILLNYIINEIRKSGYMGEILIKAEPRENSISLERLQDYYKSMGLTLIQQSNTDCMNPEILNCTNCVDFEACLSSAKVGW